MFGSEVNVEKITSKLQQEISANQISRSNSQTQEGTTTIGDDIARKMEQSPQFDFLFMVKMPDINVNKNRPTGVSLPLNSNANSGIASANVSPDDINHRVFTTNAPITQFDSVKNTDMGTFMYSAGHADIGTLNLVMDEFNDGATLAYLLEWQKKIKNGDGTYNPPFYYKHDIKVVRLSASKLETSVHTYKDCVPISIDPMTFSHDSNQILQYSVTFSVDDAEHIMVKPQQLKNFMDNDETSIINNIRDGSSDPIKTRITAQGAKGILEKIRASF